MAAFFFRMRFNWIVVPVLAALSLNSCIPCPTLAETESEDPGFTLKDIEHAWRSRQERAASLSMEWRTTRIITKGAIVPEHPTISLGLPAPFPERDVELDFEQSLLVDNGRLRYIEVGEYWDNAKKVFAKGEARTIWNGTEGREFFALSGDDFQEGRITDVSTIISDASAGPPLLANWPLDPKLGNMRMEEYSLTGQTGVIGDHKCAVLRKVSGGILWNEIWVDVERQFLILRALSRKDQVIIVNQADIEYERDDHDGWYPAHWEWNTLKGDGSLKENSRSDVVAYCPSPDVAVDDFRLEFPVATIFMDQRSSDEVRFIVRPDGTHRKVLDEEFYGGVAKETLMNTDPGQARDKGSFSWRVLAGLGGLLLMALALLAAFRRR